MNAHYMKINPDKTELLLLYPNSLEKDVIIKGILFDDQCIRFANEVKNVGVWIDKYLLMNKHVNKTVSHCFKLLKDIGRIRKFLSMSNTERLVHAVVSCRTDYCNSLLINTSQSYIAKLQKVQNAAARLITLTKRRESVRQVLRDLHWLDVETRIVFKILLLVHKVIRGNCSNNLSVNYKLYNCRPQDYLLLDTPCFKTKYGTRTFDYAGPRLWNALPVHIRVEESTDVFKKMVKTLLFDCGADFKRRAFKFN